jgi:hypothetical protein
MTLVEFLLARIAEDEGRARSALGLLGIETEWHRVEWLRDRGLTRSDAQHMTHHSPRRVLAECEAKRRIVEEFAKEQWVIEQGHRTEWTEAGQATRETALRHLAGVYADHPDYDEAWRP